MTDSPGDPAEGTAPSRRSAGMPRWVKVSLIIGLVLVAVFVVVSLAGGGEHGPGRHSGSGPFPAFVTGS